MKTKILLSTTIAIIEFALTVSAQTTPSIVFTNQIASSGLNANNGGYIHAVLDYNNDGYEDIIYSNDVTGTRIFTLMRNNGNLSFSNVTASLGIANNVVIPMIGTSSTSIIAVDYNNDGWKDVMLLQSTSTIKVYKNNSGNSFTDVTSSLNIPIPLTSTSEISSFATPSDYDKDGDIDIIISRTLSNNSRVISVIKNNLSLNTFSIVDVFTISTTNAVAAQIRSIDYDNDQDDDILFIFHEPKGSYAAGSGYFCLQSVKLLNNNGSGVFSDVSSSSGLGQAYSRNGATVFDYDNDGLLDLLFGSDDGYFPNCPNGICALTKLYRNVGGVFVDSSVNVISSVIPNTEAYYYYTSTIDFDNDADFDVYQGVGWCDGTPNQLYRNNNNTFADNASAYGLGATISTYQCCGGNGSNVWFDADKDGDLDVFVGNFVGDSHFMVNPLNTNNSKYLRIKLSGSNSNKDAKGTRVVVKIGAKQLTQFLGFSLGSNIYTSDIFHFGLGTANSVDSVIVYWSSGNQTRFGSTAANQMLQIQEGGFTTNLKMYFESYYENGRLRSSLYDADGMSEISMCDTIQVLIHDSITNSIVWSTKTTIDTAGNCILNIPSNYVNTRKSIGINHRASIETWSANQIVLSDGITYDFTTSASKALGDNLTDLGGGKYAMYCGDINQDGSVDFNDYPDLDMSSNFGYIGYYNTDLNGDASVDFNDYPIIDINSNNGVLSFAPTYTAILNKPSIATNPVSSISQTSADCGGNILSLGYNTIFARGICWSTSANPSIFLSTKIINGGGIGPFTSSMTGLNPATTYYVRAFAINATDTAYGNEISFTTQSLQLGQNYAGGIIFYIDGTGQHGLACASSDLGQFVWGCSGISIGTTSVNQGTGAANTIAIVNGCSLSTSAARTCDNLVSSGLSDWYLPSKAELALMRQNLYLNGWGSFSAANYWSSSEFSSSNAWLQNFSTGTLSNSSKSNSGKVRAVRSY